MFSLHLSGKNLINENNLKGTSNIQVGHSSLQLQNFQRDVVMFFILPLSLKQWSVVKQNLFFIPKFKKRLANLREKANDVSLYQDLFSLLELIADEHKQVEDLEVRLNSMLSTRDQFFTMVYKTKRIKLLPEYEIYDSILGKPSREKGQQYRCEIVSLIKLLLERDKVTYDLIKNRVLGEVSNNGDNS